jgi:histidine ammonia-lyase
MPDKTRTISLTGRDLTRADVCAVARGKAKVVLDAQQLARVQRTAAHRARDGLPGGNPEAPEGTLLEELQRNLVITHAVCVGEPFAADVVRAMLVIRVNTLMRGHSGIRASTLQALAALLEHDIVPLIPQSGSVGASGDLAPLSHLAIVLLGGGEAWYRGERMSGADALQRAGLAPIALSHKEGLALNNGTTQMLACAVLALEQLEALADTADIAAAMTLDAFAGRSSAFRPEVHALRPHPGQERVAANLRRLLAGSTLVDIPYHLVPSFRTWTAQSWQRPDEQARRFDLGWHWVPPSQRHGREAFYSRFLPFKGGKKHQPQDAYSLRCIPQVHGAVRDAIAQAVRVIEIELNAVTDNPLVFPDAENPRYIEDQVISAGHFHGMPLALAMSYVKAAIPVLASISERRLNKLLDPSTNDGLPAFLIGNEDGTDSGFMIVQYTAAAIVNDLATRAHPASVYNIPTSANAEDHVSMGANEARHVLEMCADLSRVLALELYTAAQALEYRQDMLNVARAVAQRGDAELLGSKVANAPLPGQPQRAQFDDEVRGLCAALAAAGEFHPGPAVQRAFATIRARVPFMPRDRAMDGDVKSMCELVASGELLR